MEKLDKKIFIRKYFSKKKIIQELENKPYLFALLGFSIIFIALLVLSENFFTASNLFIISRQVAVNAILAIGMTFVILAGEIDLSVGAVAALIGCIVATLISIGQSYLIAVLAGILLGGVVGFINGIIVAKVRIPAIITTLAMMEIARGSALLYTKGYPIAGLPAFVSTISQGGNPLLILIVLYGFATFTLSKTKAGHYLYAVGGGREATRYSGINVNKYIIFAFIVCGVMAALAGVMLVSRTGSGQPNAGIGFELTAIAAVVLGGTSITGGRGHIICTLFGALTIALINNGLNLLDINPFTQQVLRGVIIICAIYMNNLIKSD